MKNTLFSITLTSLLAVIMAGCGQPVPANEWFQSNQTLDRAGLEVPPTTMATTGEAARTESLLPNGFTSDTRDGLGLSFFALDGLSLGEIRLPARAWVSKDTLHIAGANTGSPNFPLIYFQPSFEGNCDGCGLWLLGHDQSNQLLHFNEIEALVGVPAADLVAFVERLPQPESGILRSSMYLGTPSSLPTSQPVLVVDSKESLGIVPIAIRMTSHAAAGIYYTYRPYGIGGEILFDPRMGLSYLDLATNKTSEILPEQTRFSNLSPSMNLAAYSVGMTGEVAGFKILDLGSGQEMFFQALPDSDRGAGMVVISPDDTRLAWLEARGSLTEDNFHAILRVASMDGKSMQDYPQENFIKTAGLGVAIWVTPLGWLDNSNLLVGVRSMGKDSQAANLRLDVLTGGITFLAPGLFCGFLYP